MPEPNTLIIDTLQTLCLQAHLWDVDLYKYDPTVNVARFWYIKKK